MSTRIHSVVRGLGRPVRSALAAGQEGDAPQAAALVTGLPADAVLADAACGSGRPRDAIAGERAKAVIPNNPARSYAAVVTRAAIVLRLRQLSTPPGALPAAAVP